MKRIAIIGSGISGLTCAHILSNQFDVTIFEANDYIGGHTNTVQINDQHAIDTGFIVFNFRNYPLFTKLIDQLNVAHQQSEMSFSVSSERHQVEYNGYSLGTLFGQTRNLIRPKFYQMLRDVMRFYEQAKAYLLSKRTDLSLQQFIDQHRFGHWFWQLYCQPMVSAIWSSKPAITEQMPAHFILGFFDNHGLLGINNAPQWHTIKGGSQSYVRALLDQCIATTHTNARVLDVERLSDEVLLKVGAERLSFDAVIFACHSDTALSLLKKPTESEVNVLGDIPYHDNEVVLHVDNGVMPKRRKIWASWNYHQSETALPTLTYYMNRLQALDIPDDYFVSVNHTSNINPERIIQTYQYSHPVFDQKAISAQQQFHRISGHNNSYFCGAYWFNGFHEDGVASAVRVCKQLGVSF